MLSDTFIVNRMTNELSWELTEQIGTTYNDKIVADSRIARWDAAFDAISEKPLFGYGTHSEKDVLAHFYKLNGLDSAYHNRYDAHNIYLSYLLEYGIFGLLIFLLWLISNLFLAIKSRNFIYFLLFFMVGVVGCFESYLKNNAAITFVAFFGSVLLFSSFTKEIKNGSL